jgi:hypothetical protein
LAKLLRSGRRVPPVPSRRRHHGRVPGAHRAAVSGRRRATSRSNSCAADSSSRRSGRRPESSPSGCRASAST